MAQTIKLSLDEDAIDHRLIQALRARSFDVLTVVEAGRSGASDQDQLDYATSSVGPFSHSIRVILPEYTLKDLRKAGTTRVSSPRINSTSVSS